MSVKNLFPSVKPTADFNFAATKTLDPRITFSRASPATYYDGKTLAKAEENLLLNSTTLVTQSIYVYDKVYTLSFEGTGSVVLSGAHTATLTGTGVSDRVSLTFTPSRAALTLMPSGTVTNAQLEQRGFVGPYTPTTTSAITNWQPALLSAPSGMPRFQHDPVSGKSLGYLSERQMTNLLAESEFYNGIQTAGGVTLGKMFSPSGEVANAAVFAPGATSKYLYPKTLLTVSASTVYAVSVFVKMDDGLAPAFGHATPANAANDFYLVVGNTAIDPTTYRVQNVGNGLYRVSGSVTTGTINLGNHYIYRYSTNSGRGFRVTGWQIEQHSKATSYIKTEGSQVTRLADNATIEGAALDSFYNQRGGTFLIDAMLSSAATAAVLNLSYGTANSDRLNIYVTQGSSTLSTDNLVNSTASGSVSAAGAIPAQPARCVVVRRAAGYSHAVCVNGGAVTVSSSGQLGARNRLVIGATAGGAVQLDSPIARLAYYDEVLTDAQMQALTRV